jgi:N-hydroxyarylamine O-acetyltransferase
MERAVDSLVDLNACLARVCFTGELAANESVLEALHLAHATHIPFENFDVVLRRPIRLDLEGLQEKLVRGGRGGYCFEQNTLLEAVLKQVGFRVTALAARVRLGAARVGPRAHMVLKVDGDWGSSLADVGFGGEGPLKPVPLVPDQVSSQYGRTYRATREGDLWVVQLLRGETWEDLYAFSLEPQLAVDFEVTNYYTATHPSSYFLRTATAQLSTPEARYVLRDREFTIERGAEVSRRTIEHDEDLLDVLAVSFGLVFPRGTRFPAPRDPPLDAT